MPLTEKNKDAVLKDVMDWMDSMARMRVGMVSVFEKAEELTVYIMDLCQKAYDKGVQETKQNQNK